MAEKDFVLIVDEWRQATKYNDQDIPVRFKDHKRGDIITLDEEHEDALRLVEAGALREADDADREAAESARATEAADGPQRLVEAPVVKTATTVDEDIPVDQYDDENSFTFGDLQSLAKDRGLNAGGSRADIVTRLREYDRENA